MPINVVILLLFKPSGRGRRFKNLIITPEDHLALSKSILEGYILSRKSNTKLFVDNCFAPLLSPFKIVPTSFEPCTGARYSLDIDWNMRAIPCSLVGEEGKVSLKEYSLKDVWFSDSFKKFRNGLIIPKGKCKNCDAFNLCLGGCQAIPEMNFCNRDNNEVY
ncbi:MAG: SPASM domain-containing protein [Promethearchaeota archaeon]|nr:MAG: SPASM domain-containing protein [Candidatus Lokiarchaeota archaeon]